MPHALRFLSLLIFLGTTFVSCKRESDKADPDPQEPPRILSMSVEGIPEQAIRIDPEKREITIALPDKYRIRRPQIGFQLTAKSRILAKSGESYVPDALHFDLGSLQEHTWLVGVAAEGATVPLPASAVVDYRIRLVQPGKLAIRLIPEDSFNAYTIGDRNGFILVGENFYDDSDHSAQLILTRKGGSASDQVVISSNQTQQYIADAGVANTQYPVQIRVTIPDQVALLPGEYALELRKANGRSAVSPEGLVVKKGPIRLGAFPHYLISQRSLNGAEVTLDGLNLFENSNLEVELKHADGTVIRRKPQRFSRFGTALTFAPGSGAKPGHYRLRLLENGQPVTTCYRLAVTKTTGQPSITSFGNTNTQFYQPGNEVCDPDNPLYVVRDAADGGRFQLVLQTAPLAGSNLRTALKLVSVAQPPQVVEVPFQVDVYSSAVLEQFSASVQFPEAIPAGPYRMSVVVTDKTANRTTESEPFERVIEIR
ncbi:hypothetical protein GCM10027299_11760 [Larkinella ripae]